MQKIDKNIIGIISGIALVAVSVIPALAEDSGMVRGDTEMGIKPLTGKPTGIKAEVRAGIKADKMELKAEGKTKVEAMKAENKDERGTMRSDIKSKVEAMKVDVKAMKEAGATPEQIKAKVDEVRAANQADREAFRAQLEEKRKTLKDDIKKEMDAFKEGKKVKLDAASKAEAKQKLGSAFGKLGVAINKLVAFDKKLSDEIVVRKAKGLDTGAVESALDLARRALEESKVSVDAVNSAVNASVDSTVGTSKEAIKSVVNAAVESVKLAKTKYQEAMKLLPKTSDSQTETEAVEVK